MPKTVTVRLSDHDYRVLEVLSMSEHSSMNSSILRAVHTALQKLDPDIYQQLKAQRDLPVLLAPVTKGRK
jgi:hypothetical protein